MLPVIPSVGTASGRTQRRQERARAQASRRSLVNSGKEILKLRFRVVCSVTDAHEGMQNEVHAHVTEWVHGWSGIIERGMPACPAMRSRNRMSKLRDPLSLWSDLQVCCTGGCRSSRVEIGPTLVRRTVDIRQKNQ